MSRLKTRRSDDHQIPVSITTPEKLPRAASSEDVNLLLSQCEHVRTLPELGGLVIRARTAEALEIAVTKAKQSAKNSGYMSAGEQNFRNQLRRIRKLNEAKKPVISAISESKKLPVVDIGTDFNSWRTTSLPYFEDKFSSKRGYRVTVVDVVCTSCEGEPTKIKKPLSEVKSGKSKRCNACGNNERRKSREATRLRKLGL